MMVPLSPCLIFGLGPFPELGIAGSAISLLAYYVAGTIILAWYILAGRCVVKFTRAALRLADLHHHPEHRRRRHAGVAADQPDGLGEQRAGVAAWWRRRSRRLWHGCAARIPDDPAGVRAWRTAGRHGRHQYRRRQSPARAADRADRRRGRLRRDRDDRPLRRAVSRKAGSGCSPAMRRRSRSAATICASSVRRSASSGSASACISRCSAPTCCSGRSSARCCAARSPSPAARSPRSISARCTRCSSCSRWRCSSRERSRC